MPRLPIVVLACLAVAQVGWQGACSVAQAQPGEVPAAELRVELDAPQVITAGEPFQLRVIVRYHGASGVELELTPDEWTNLELRARASAQRSLEVDGRRELERVFALDVVAPQEGRVYLPGSPLTYSMEGEPSRQLAPSFSRTARQPEVSLLSRLWPIALGLFGLVAVGGLIWGIVTGVKRARRAREALPPSPTQQLEADLQALRQARLGGQGQAYFAQAERVLYAWLRLGFDLDRRFATADELAQALRDRECDPRLTQQASEMTQRILQGKFSPAGVTMEELERFEKEFLALIELRPRPRE